jgi:hypothetical protein
LRAVDADTHPVLLLLLLLLLLLCFACVRGIAFITFKTQEGADAALACNGEQVDGQTLKVWGPLRHAAAAAPAAAAAAVAGCGCIAVADATAACEGVSHMMNTCFEASHVCWRTLHIGTSSLPVTPLTQMPLPRPGPSLMPLQVEKAKATAVAKSLKATAASTRNQQQSQRSRQQQEQHTPNGDAPVAAAAAAGGATGEGPARTPGYNVAYVGNIAFEARPEDISALFDSCNVTKVRRGGGWLAWGSQHADFALVVAVCVGVGAQMEAAAAHMVIMAVVS